MKKEVFIIAACRTPLGSLNGSLSEVSAPHLGAAAIRGCLDKFSIPSTQIQEVIMGNVVSSNIGQAPSNQASIYAGIPDSVPCSSVNKVCASGMKAVMIGTQSIQLGINDLVVTGGMENMSQIPYYLDRARNGYRLGHGILVDGILRDGLWDPYNDIHMGTLAERCSSFFHISREEQDNYAVQSYQRAQKAQDSGFLLKEICPVKIPGRNEVLVNSDEEIRKVNYEKLPLLRPAFQIDGAITAANASKISDGAAALILASSEKVKELGLSPLARILSYSDASQSPEWFTTSPTLAMNRSLELAGLGLKDIDFIELNEAFSCVALINARQMGINNEKLNIWGGGISLGHPIGCSGARILVTLCSILKEMNGNYGLAGICNGGGGASAMVLQRL